MSRYATGQPDIAANAGACADADAPEHGGASVDHDGEHDLHYLVQGYDLELQLSGGVLDYQHLPSVYQGIFELQVSF